MRPCPALCNKICYRLICP
uniref:Uncharacterized protein n=1 Tax=Arundo donax TaxID=35708 RepID=A0A0A8Y796_ARUDO